MEFWTAVILGLVGSLHCAGMCGPLALALPAGSGTVTRQVAGRTAYNLGRVLTYAFLGLIVGSIGQTLALAGLQRAVSISLGMLLIAGIFVSPKIGVTRPVLALVARLKLGMSALLKRRSLLALLLLGTLNGLLPCGLVYVACAAAAASGRLASSALYMAAFGAGTIPMLLAIGFSRQLAPPSWRLRLTKVKVIPVSVFLLGTLLVLRGLSLGIPFLSPELAPHGLSCHR